jgi:mRNA-degrading endonuclease RelE of RelBE toxin-antitoxin system
MASDDWQIVLESGAERDLGRLGNPSLVREAREVIDDLRFDPVPPSAVKMRRNSDAYRVKFGADAYRIVYRVDQKRRVIRVFAIGPLLNTGQSVPPQFSA